MWALLWCIRLYFDSNDFIIFKDSLIHDSETTSADLHREIIRGSYHFSEREETGSICGFNYSCVAHNCINCFTNINDTAIKLLRYLKVLNFGALTEKTELSGVIFNNNVSVKACVHAAECVYKRVAKSKGCKWFKLPRSAYKNPI